MALPAIWKLIQAPIVHCTQCAHKSPSVSLQAKGNTTPPALGRLMGESVAVPREGLACMEAEFCLE
jgi:hypothetical protein